MIWSSFTDLIHLTGWAPFLWLGWTATAGTSRRIWEEDPSNQTVYAGGELETFWEMFGTERKDEIQRDLIRFNYCVFFSVHICFESFRWKQDGIDFLIVVQPEECLRDWKKWCFSDLKDTVELVLQSYRSVRAIYNDQIPPVGHPKGWWTGRESPQMWP